MWFFALSAVVLLTVLWKLFKPREKSLEGRHVLITGGSSGIGKSLAVLAAQGGAHVSIIARNVANLNQAKIEISKHSKEGRIVTAKPADVSDKSSVDSTIAELEEQVGPIFMLVNCAGLAICGQLEEMKEEDVKHLINVNLLGTIFPTQAVLTKMKQQREGIVVITGSVVSLMGLFGYSIYSSTKFALRGLAESLYMEARPYNISVTLALPPDTDTPGFKFENKSKPKQTQQMAESGGLKTPEEVAAKILKDALQKRFFSFVGLEGFIVTTLCLGMSPFQSVVDLLWQCLILGPLRLIAGFYVKQFEGIVDNCHVDQQTKKD